MDKGSNILTFENKKLLFVDFETFFDRKDGYDLKSVSMCEYVRDAKFHAHGFSYAWNIDGMPKWCTVDPRDEFAGVDWANVVIIAHNVKFDGSILAWRFGIRPYAYFDTAALSRAVLGELVSGHSLKVCAEYLGLPAKGELSCDGVRNPSPEQLAALGTYCNTDVTLCQGIFNALYCKFPQSQLWSMDWTIRCFIDAKLTLNTAVLEEGVKNEKARREDAISRSGVLREVLSSNKKFAEHLENSGFTVPTKTSVSTGKQIPAFARTDAGLAAVLGEDSVLYKARLAAKSSLLETRGESLLAVGRTGAFPFDVNFSGAVQTHRYSGGSGAGGNPQNFTRGSFLRGAVEVRQPQSLVVGDFAAIELRILSWLAREPRLINAIIGDQDVYSDFAGRFYGRTITKADKVERQFGKCAILGLGYGMGWKRFRESARIDAAKLGIKLELSEKESQETVDLYRSTYINVKKLWDTLDMMLPLIATGQISCFGFAPFVKVRKEEVVLPSGLSIRFPGLRKGRYFDRKSNETRVGWHYYVHYGREPAPLGIYGAMLLENLCQGLAGELCKEAIYRAEAVYGMRCAGQVHDEIISISDGKTDEDMATLEICMSQSPKWWPEIRLKAEVGSGGNWANAKS